MWLKLQASHMAAKLATSLLLCPAWREMQTATVDAATGWRTEQTHICARCTHLLSVCEDSGPPNPQSEATACGQAAQSGSVVNEQQISKEYSQNSLRLNIVCPSYLTKTPDWSHCQEQGKDSEERGNSSAALSCWTMAAFIPDQSCFEMHLMPETRVDVWSNWNPGLELHPLAHCCRQVSSKHVTEAVRSPESWYRCEETQLYPYTQVSVPWKGFKIF